MSEQRLRVASFSDFGPEWRWIEARYQGVPPIDFLYYSARRGTLLSRLPGPNWGRVRAALQLGLDARRGRVDMVVSQMPRNSHYASAVSLRGIGDIPHFAAGFNFTDLPTGFRLEAMRRSFARIAGFAVFSQMERQLYADVFGLPVERFHFVHWGVAPPIAEPLPRAIAEPYVAAIGGEARDYRTLADAAQRLPNLRFVVIARPHSLDGIDLPPNVTVLVNRPWIETWSIAAHAEALLVPLRSGETPNGIVTIVGGAYLGKAQIVTDSIGIHDDVRDGETGLLVPAGDGAAFAAAIERLLDEPALAARLSIAARTFAETYCTEQVSADFALAQVVALTGVR